MLSVGVGVGAATRGTSQVGRVSKRTTASAPMQEEGPEAAEEAAPPAARPIVAVEIHRDDYSTGAQAAQVFGKTGAAV